MNDAQVVYLHPAKHAVEALVQPGWHIVSAYELLPVGIPGMLNLLREHGLRVIGLNTFLETILNPKFDLRGWLSTLVEPRLFAIDLHWYEHAFGALDLTRLIKQVHPDVPVVLGGFTASLFADEILTDHPEVDYIIRGDGEAPLLALAEATVTSQESASRTPNLVYRRAGAIDHTPMTYCATQAELDRLDFVDMAWLTHARHYQALLYSNADKQSALRAPTVLGHWLTIGRGCCFNCAFCGGGREAQQHISGRHGIVARDATRVADDIERLQSLGVKQVLLNLDPATMGRGFWEPLFGELQRRKVRIGLYNECFQVPDDAFLDAFVETADLPTSKLAFTPLSGSEDVRALNGKSFTNERLLEALSRLKAGRVHVMIFFSLNVSGETEKTFRQTLRLARAIRDLYPASLLGIVNMLHTMDPGSPMSQRPEEYGIQSEFSTFRDYYAYCLETAIVDIKPGSLGGWRGYAPANRALQSLESMAREWNRFCGQRPGMCFPVPRGW